MRSAIIRGFALFFLLSLPFPLFAQTRYAFEVDTDESSIVLGIEASLAGIMASDQTTSRLSGTVTADLTPHNAPFSEIQILGIDVTLEDSLYMRLDFGNIAGRLDIAAPPDEIHLSLSEAGEPAIVTDTTFIQTGNTFHIGGTLWLASTGLISIAVGDSTVLDSELLFDVEGSITQIDDELRLRLPLAIADTSEISDVPFIVQIDGVIVATAPVGVTAAAETLPSGITLAQNYPNPFNPQTAISYTVERPGPVTLRVYDAIGRLVATLVDGPRSAGAHEAVFDGADLPSGIYMYRLVANGQESNRMMVLLK